MYHIPFKRHNLYAIMSGFQNDEAYLAEQFQAAGNITPSTPRAEEETPAPLDSAIEAGRLGVVDIDVFFVQDVSGSMREQRGPVAAGMNEIIDDLQSRYPDGHPFKARLSLTTFSSYDNIRVGELKPISEIQPIRAEDLVCDGSTAMRDAVARVIDKATEESGGRTIVLKAFTDGQDNDSRLGSITLAQCIDEFKKGHTNRSVLFIGSDPMAFDTAGGIGLTRHQSIKHTLDDTPSAYRACAHAVARCATGETPSAEFNDADILLSEGGSQSYQHYQHRVHTQPPQQQQAAMMSPDGMNSYDVVDMEMMSDDVPSRR
jgi:hypothetical protein